MGYGTIKADGILDSNGDVLNILEVTSDEATTSVKGMMSAADKTKLDGIEAGADANTVEPSDLATKADLVGGKVPNSQLPSVAITEYLGEVSNETAMLALSGEEGDWAIRTDTSSTWVITGSNPAQAASWTELAHPSDQVSSVNGYQGAVVLGAADVGAASSSINLQSVTSNGSTTTSGITAAGAIVSIGDPSGGATNGTRLGSTVVCAAPTGSSPVWNGHVVGTAAPTSVILADGSITADGDIQGGGNPYGSGSAVGAKLDPDGGFVVRRSSGDVFTGKSTANNGAVTSSISADGSITAGSATFAGDIIVGNGGFASQDKTGLYLAATAGFCNVYHSASTSGDFLSFTKYDASASGNYTTQAKITDSGAATFAGTLTSSLPSAGYAYQLNNGSTNLGGLYRDTGSSRLILGDGSTTKIDLQGSNGSVMISNDISLERPTAPSNVKISGSDTHAVWLSDGKFALKYDGSAEFANGSSGRVKINTTSGTSKLNVYPETGASAPGYWQHCGLAIGNSTAIGDHSQIGLGYFNLGSYAPSYFGFVSTNNAGYGAGDLVFGTRNVATDSQATERMRIKSSGEIVLPDGSPGIQFGSVSGSVSSTNLDDYEEGTFTPGIFQGITSPSYGSQQGIYTKVGNILYYYLHLEVTGGTPNASTLQISGLPYISMWGGYLTHYTSSTYYLNSGAGFGDELKPLLFPNSSHIYMYRQTATSVSTLSGTSVVKTSSLNRFQILLSGFYRVA